MAAPPFQAGAVQLTCAETFAGEAAAPVGGSGTVRGMMAAEGLDGRPVPVAFVPVTVKLYEAPLVRPPTVQLVAPVVVQVAPPGAAVTVYPVMAPPLLAAAAAQDTAAWRSPGTPVT